MISIGPPQDAKSLRIALDGMPIPVTWARLSDLRIIFMNRIFTETFGFVPEDFEDINDWIARQYPYAEDRAQAAARWSAFLQAPPNSRVAVEPIEIRVRCKDGTVKTVINSGTILPDAGWALATFVDISTRKRDEIFLREAARQARENQAIYQTLLDHANEMIILSPFDRSRRYVSPAVTRLTGFTPAEYLALEPSQMSHPSDLAPTLEVLANLRQSATTIAFRYRALQKDGSYNWVEAIATSYVDPHTKRPAGLVATVRDISQEIEREKHRASEHSLLAKAASHDELTGIANRRTFNQTLAREANPISRTSGDLSLLLIDVDHFKLYNDRLGHLEGDACLRSVARTIESTVGRATDLVARFGGEEFVVLSPMTSAAGVAILAERIREAVVRLKLPHPAVRRGVVTVSIGGSTLPASGQVDEPRLIECADRALYLAKAEGRNAFRFLACDAELAA